MKISPFSAPDWSALARVPLFAELKPEDLQEICQVAAQVCQAEKDTRILRVN